MEVSILQALLIGVVASLTCIEGDFLGECKLREPLVTGFLVGLILGEPVKGVIIGGQLQLIWMGATGIAKRLFKTATSTLAVAVRSKVCSAETTICCASI